MEKKRAFTLTKFIYPIEETELFAPLQLTFDNPKTDEEINIVKKFLEKSLQVNNTDLNDDLSFRLTFNKSDFVDRIHEIDKGSYADDFYQNTWKKNESLIDILSKTWIIIRYPDPEESFEEVRKDNNKIFKFWMGEKAKIDNTFSEIKCFCHVLSLLSHNQLEGYYNKSFLLNENPFQPLFTADRHVIRDIIEKFNGNCSIFKHDNRAKSWLFWLDGKYDLLLNAKRINKIYSLEPYRPNGIKVRSSQKQSVKQKVKHVGNHLRMAYQHRADPELLVILLFGIIEYLLTRSPSSAGISISKQIQENGPIAIDKNLEGDKLKQLQKELKKNYDIRSDTAHGNYIDHQIKEKLVEATFSINDHLRSILNTYIENKTLIDNLKDKAYDQP